MNQKLTDIPNRWVLNELRDQRNKLRMLKEATQWTKLEAYQRMLKMREEIVQVCERYAKMIDK